MLNQNNEQDSYLHFSTEDFLDDEFFRKSVLQPTKQSKRFWDNFLKSYPEKIEQIKEAETLLRTINGHFASEIQDVDPSRAKASFENLSRQLKPTKKGGQLTARKWRTRMGIAASFLFLLTLGFLAFWPKEDDQITFSTGNGQRLPLELPDGSLVQLNANSTLYYHQDDWWDQDKRQVWLNGEAYFDVKKKALGPKFIVNGVICE